MDGKAYDVVVQMLEDVGGAPASAPVAAPVAAPTPQPSAPAPAPTPAPVSSSGAGDIPSPLAGKIVSIDVQMGQSVKEGQQVLTLEAMKMNTYIYAPKAGSVAAILVKPGDAVEEGKVLIRLN